MDAISVSESRPESDERPREVANPREGEGIEEEAAPNLGV
jgi:hypothetical protein